MRNLWHRDEDDRGADILPLVIFVRRNVAGANRLNVNHIFKCRMTHKEVIPLWHLLCFVDSLPDIFFCRLDLGWNLSWTRESCCSQRWYYESTLWKAKKEVEQHKNLAQGILVRNSAIFFTKHSSFNTLMLLGNSDDLLVACISLACEPLEWFKDNTQTFHSCLISCLQNFSLWEGCLGA